MPKTRREISSKLHQMTASCGMEEKYQNTLFYSQEEVDKIKHDYMLERSKIDNVFTNNLLKTLRQELKDKLHQFNKHPYSTAVEDTIDIIFDKLGLDDIGNARSQPTSKGAVSLDASNSVRTSSQTAIDENLGEGSIPSKPINSICKHQRTRRLYCEDCKRLLD